MARFGRSRPKAVVPLDDLIGQVGRRDARVGALGRALGAVEQLGVATPESWVVVADVFRQVVHAALPPGHDPASLLRTVQRPVGVERAAKARELLLEAPFEANVERELDRAWRALSEGAPWGVAVRASAIVADQGVARAASLSRTELPIFTREALGDAIRRVWASSASEATLHYLRARRVRDLALSVVLQPVVPARANITLVTDARALFTPPDSGHDPAGLHLAFASCGLASEATDLSTTELVTFGEDGAVRSSRAATDAQCLLVRDRALVWGDPPSASAVLDAGRVTELAELATRLDALGPTVARCVVSTSGHLLVVDTEPCYHLGHPGAGTAETLWGRDAAGEAPASPLTELSHHLLSRTLLERARRAFPRRSPRAAKTPGILATIDGRPYLSLSPAFERSGGEDGMDPIARLELSSAQWTRDLEREPLWRPSLARAGLRIAQIATEQRALSDEVTRFEREAEQERRWLAEMDLAILPDDALTTTLHEVSDFSARAYSLHARASAAALGGHALLASVIAGTEATRASWLAHSITSGADVITARPAAAFAHVAAIALYDEAARSKLADGITSPRELPDGPLSRALGHFLKAYGDRGLFEAELEAPRWAEDATPILRMLSLVAGANAIDPDLAASRARGLADRQLALLEPRLSFFETRVVRDIVARQRDLLRLRERCQERVAHGLSMLRVVALDVDRRIRRLDPTLEAGAAFMLKLDELVVAVAKYRADLAPVVRARRAGLLAKRRTRPWCSVFRGVPRPQYPVPIPGLLKGVRASAGTAEGRVVRLGEALEGLARFSPGDVLVVPALDVGLVPLFLHAGAIVADLGTPFSSSSVVARDCGLPVVTAVSGALVLLRDGERVRVDGDLGTVERLGS